MEVRTVPIGEVVPWEKNPRGILKKDYERLKAQIRRLGVYKPLVACSENGKYIVLGGNMRIRALQELGFKEVEISIVEARTEKEKIEYSLSDNDRAGYYEEDKLAELVYPHLGEINLEDFKVDLGQGIDIKQLIERFAPNVDGSGDELRATLFDRFLVPPFSVLDAEEAGGGTSIFDPTLCELVYRWFCPPGGSVLDPFAGGSVRGIVAGMCGLRYVGIELRGEQVTENEKQAQEIAALNPGKSEASAATSPAFVRPSWVVGDAVNVETLAPGRYDLIFTCPPYYDLERYSDLPGELSAMRTYEEFLKAIRKIVARSVAMLKPNRFAVVVVGDVRDKMGFYRKFPWHTIKAFEAAGARLYNEAVLVTAIGSLPIRVGVQFGQYRKLGKTYQNVLVFYKGDVKAIPKELGEIKIENEWLAPEAPNG